MVHLEFTVAARRKYQGKKNEGQQKSNESENVLHPLSPPDILKKKIWTGNGTWGIFRSSMKLCFKKWVAVNTIDAKTHVGFDS